MDRKLLMCRELEEFFEPPWTPLDPLSPLSR